MTKLKIHDIVPRSFVNGPGPRACIWLQGCSLACPGCFNPETHSFESGQLVDVKEIAEQILSFPALEGLSISGGEPLQQAEGLLELLRIIKEGSQLSILIFSGFEPEEIESFPVSAELYKLVDVIVAGRYKQEQHLAGGLRGSANQAIILCSDRYKHEDFEKIPALELVINSDGSITITGIDPPELNLHETRKNN